MNVDLIGRCGKALLQNHETWFSYLNKLSHAVMFGLVNSYWKMKKKRASEMEICCVL